MRLNFHVQGDGFPLVILHGFLGSSDNWRAMSKRFAAHFKVYCLDLRNHGGSPHSQTMTYGAMAEDLGEFFANEKIGRAHLLGHSLGGKTSMQFTTDRPNSVARLVVVDIAPRAYPPTHGPLLAALGRLDLTRIASFGAADRALADDIGDTELRQFLVKNLARGADQSFHWRIGLAQIIASYDELTEAITPSGRIDTPACFIRAGKSRFIDDADIPKIDELFTNARIADIADAGHWVHIDAPELFYRTVTGFLLG